jgi:hypothetical protein
MTSVKGPSTNDQFVTDLFHEPPSFPAQRSVLVHFDCIKFIELIVQEVGRDLLLVSLNKFRNNGNINSM